MNRLDWTSNLRWLRSPKIRKMDNSLLSALEWCWKRVLKFSHIKISSSTLAGLTSTFKNKMEEWRVVIWELAAQIVTPRRTRTTRKAMTYRAPQWTSFIYQINKNIDRTTLWRKLSKHPPKTEAAITITTPATTGLVLIMFKWVKICSNSMIAEKPIKWRGRIKTEVWHMIITLIMQSHVILRALESKGRGQMEARKAIIVSWQCRQPQVAVSQITGAPKDLISLLIR